MKPGTYRVSFIVDLNEEYTEDQAHSVIGGMIADALDEDNFPELNFETVEEFDLEYHLEEEDEVEELNF